MGVCSITCARMRAAVVDARGRVQYHLCQNACSGGGYAWACAVSFVPECVQRSWMRVGVCSIICARTPAAVVAARGRVQYHLCQNACSGAGCAWACAVSLVPEGVQRWWMRVSVCSIICARMRAAVVDSRGRVQYHLCQNACSGCGCGWARAVSFVPACVQRLWMRVGVCSIICARMRAAVADAREYDLCHNACSGGGCAWACAVSFVPECVQRWWMRVGVCSIICARTPAAVVDARGCAVSFVPECLQRW